MTPGESLYSGKTVGSGSAHGPFVAGASAIPPAEGKYGGRDVKPEHSGGLASGDRQEDGVTHGHIHRPRMREGLPAQRDWFHREEDKEPRPGYSASIGVGEQRGQTPSLQTRWMKQCLPRKDEMHRSTIRVRILVASMVMLAACGDAPLQSIGQRSSDWINEPEIVTTTATPVTVPTLVDSSTLQWSNDDIVNESLDDPAGLIAEVFQRREGDRFIQASRREIAAALPGVRFPAAVPHGASWVSSQLVIENSGLLSDNPSAAFGIWSAEPYTRSRSVAQLVILTVANDKETATQLAQGEADASCARFADRTTEQCQIVDISGRQGWRLISSSGTSVVWFDDAYRYELFGRSFISGELLITMATRSVALSELATSTS